MSSQAVDHLSIIGIDDKWETPKDMLKQAMIDFSINPVIDVCASAENKKFDQFIDEKMDFMKQDVKVDYFMNPKYSKKGWHTIKDKVTKEVLKRWYEPYGIDDFIKHAYDLHIKNNVSGLVLTFAKTDTKWFNKYVFNQQTKKWLAEFYPIEGRVAFEKNGVPGTNSSPYPSCWIIWRKKPSSDSSISSSSLSWI